MDTIEFKIFLAVVTVGIYLFIVWVLILKFFYKKRKTKSVTDNNEVQNIFSSDLPDSKKNSSSDGYCSDSGGRSSGSVHQSGDDITEDDIKEFTQIENKSADDILSSEKKREDDE